MPILDLKDKRLLFAIDFDARKSYAELAKRIRMSKRGVEYKLQNLEKKKVILGYAPVINISKLGYLYCRIFVKFHSLTKEVKKEIEEYIKNDEKIGWSIKYHGIFDNGFEVKGGCYTPQDGNSLLSSLAITGFFLEPYAYEEKMNLLVRDPGALGIEDKFVFDEI